MSTRSIAILGAGNGGCAAAADLGSQGLEVRLYSRSMDRLNPIVKRGGIEMTGVCGDRFVDVPVVTDDIKEAVTGADVIEICTPLTAYPFLAEKLAGLVRDDQPIFLNPGHVGGGLYLANEIARISGRHGLRICEVTTLTYGCRLIEPTVVNIIHVTTNLAFSAFPGKSQQELFDVVREFHPHIDPVENVLVTGMLCINPMEHPAQIICNAGWVEHTEGDYLFYYEGTTPSVGKVIDAVDRERMSIASTLQVPTKPFVQYFYESGYTSSRAAQTGRAYDALQDSSPNRWVKGPKSLDHRYVHEDVGWGLVPWTELGRLAQVGTPVMDALIELASVMNGIDYRTQGLTLAKLGLEQRDGSQLKSFLWNGVEASR